MASESQNKTGSLDKSLDDLRAGNRRKISGLVVDKQFQFKTAIACLSLMMLPSLIVSITLIADLALDANRMADLGLPAPEIAHALAAHAFNYALIIIGTFVFFASVSIFFSLRISNGMVGPVARLESQVKDLIDGRYEKRGDLRKGDYLRLLGDLLNELAAKLRERP